MVAPLLVDGRQSSDGQVQLDAGHFALQLGEDSGPLYLLPADLSVPFKILPEPLQKPLFVKVYSF